MASRIDPMPAWEVTNQVPPLADYDAFAADPVLPAACTMPPDEAIADQSAAAPGLGIQILDPESMHPARGIMIVLRFADGTEEQLVTDAEGFALASSGAAADAVSATMHAKASSDAHNKQRGP